MQTTITLAPQVTAPGAPYAAWYSWKVMQGANTVFSQNTPVSNGLSLTFPAPAEGDYTAVVQGTNSDQSQNIGSAVSVNFGVRNLPASAAVS